MADALVSEVLKQLFSIIREEIQQDVRLVVGVNKEAHKLGSTLKAINALALDAEKRQVMEEVVKDWIEKLKDVAYDMEDVLDIWGISIFLQKEGSENALAPFKKARSFNLFPCFCMGQVSNRRGIAQKIKEINERLDVIAAEKENFKFNTIKGIEEPERPKTTSLIDVSEIRGLDMHEKNLVGKLLAESSQQNRGLHVIPIVGMPGIGKTTLARLAYHNSDVTAHFEKKAWVSVSQPFDEVRIAKELLVSLKGFLPDSYVFETLLLGIREVVIEKRFILVLDDVWPDGCKKWEPLRYSLQCGAAGSRVLITTRSDQVAKMMGTTSSFCLDKLPDYECWLLFSDIAYFGKNKEEREELEEIGKQIAKKCDGLPLAAKTLGSLMRFKNTRQDWQNVLESEVWKLKPVEEDIFPPLFLSYNDLSSPVKRCFSYCAMFPKDFLFEKNDLIKQWMAQGFLGSECSADMEEKAAECFDDLVMHSLFQVPEKDKHDRSINSCKMHEVVHGFAQYLTKNECLVVEGGEEKDLRKDIDSHSKVRYLSLLPRSDSQVSFSFCKAKYVRDLQVLKEWRQIGTILPQLLGKFTCLRALNLGESGIEEVPREVGNLIHLRLLNLRKNNIKRLPETVENLHYLQTLDLEFCNLLEELPNGMGKLINLRHLRFELYPSSKVLPKGMGRLSSLRTLTEFLVSNDDGACNLGDLRDLNNLQGHLSIRWRAEVAADVKGAEKAKLKNKIHLQGLTLDFDRMKEEGAAGVIEALQPHMNLESLQIQDYRGSVFPSWLEGLSKLRHLTIFDCPNCGHLPKLGNLPFLETLDIYYMDFLKKLGQEDFIGEGITSSLPPALASSSSLSGTAIIRVSFPKLRRFSLSEMENWEEWEMMITDENEDDGVVRTIMPSLRALRISNCPKLTALPNHLLRMAPLEELQIRGCPLLGQRYSPQVGEDWYLVSHVPIISVD